MTFLPEDDDSRCPDIVLRTSSYNRPPQFLKPVFLNIVLLVQEQGHQIFFSFNRRTILNLN